MILRCGFTGWGSKTLNEDNTFRQHEAELRKRGVPLGAYFYGLATTEAEGHREAEFAIQLLSGRTWDLPIWYDAEDYDHYQVPLVKRLGDAGKTQLTSSIVAFMQRMEEAGYYAGYYTNLDWIRNYLDMRLLSPYDLWYAYHDYKGETKPDLAYDFGLWQYTDRYQPAWYHGGVDASIAYKSYPDIIRKAGLNGHAKSSYTVLPKASSIRYDGGSMARCQSVFYKDDIRLTCLMDPARIQTGPVHPFTERFPVGGDYMPCPYSGHEGVDQAGEWHAKIYAAMDATVLEVGYGHKFRGNYIMLGRGSCRVAFYHLSEVYVTQGETVSPDDCIGRQGTTGNSTGEHLHTSIWLNGLYVDPLPYITGEKHLPGGSETPEEASLVREWGNYPPGRYRSLVRLNVRDRPIRVGDPGTVLRVLEPGDEIEAVRQIRENVPGVWLELQDGSFACAEDSGVFVELIEKASEQILRRYPETAIFKPDFRINVRTKPDTGRSEILTQWERGEAIWYDEVIETTEHVWIHYKSTAGRDRFLAVREMHDGVRGDAWGQFFDIN